MTNPNRIYEELLGGDETNFDNSFERVSNRLANMVKEGANDIAEQINSQDAQKQIEWLISEGFSETDIKDFVGKPSG